MDVGNNGPDDEHDIDSMQPHTTIGKVFSGGRGPAGPRAMTAQVFQEGEAPAEPQIRFVSPLPPGTPGNHHGAHAVQHASPPKYGFPCFTPSITVLIRSPVPMDGERPMPLQTVFLDRDGVINERPGEGFVTRPEEFEFAPGALQALRLMKIVGLKVIVVTNQSGVGRGLMTEADLQSVHEAMMTTVREYGAGLDRIYYCPHAPDDACDCRKPLAGMLHAAQREDPSIDFSHSLLIGDSLRDLQAGHRVGCGVALVGDDGRRQRIEQQATVIHIPLAGVYFTLMDAVRHLVLPSLGATVLQSA